MAVDPISLAITAALTAVQIAFTAAQTIEGPRVKDAGASVADYGTPLNYLIGTQIVRCPCFFLKPIEEVKKKRKGKGGKQVTYTGFATWASHIADHPIDAVEKIWFDNHLVYDATGSGTKTYPLAEDYELESSLRIYKGTETQDPDPDMLAFIEARDGANTCPAYRGTSYVYFDRVPVEQLGNRFPTVQVQVSTASVAAVPPFGFTTPYPVPIPTGPRPSGANGLFFVLRIPAIRLELVSETPFVWFTSVGMAVEYDRGTNTAFSAAGHPITTDGDGNVVVTMTEVFSTVEGDVTVVSRATFLTDRVQYRVTTDRPVNVRDTSLNTTATFRTDFSWGAPPPLAPDYAGVVTDASGTVLPYSGPLALADIVNLPTQQAVKVQITGARTLGTMIGPSTGGSGGPTPTLRDLLELMADRYGLAPEECDFSAATQPIPGYVWTQASGKQVVEPLLELFDMDLRPHDFVLQAVPRGAVSQGAIPHGEFVRGDRIDGAIDPGETDLIRRLSLVFTDTGADYTPNTATPVPRNSRQSDANREASFDMTPLALDASTARQLAERMLRRRNVGRQEFSFSLGRTWIGLEPGDVWTPEPEGVARTARCTKLVLGADGRIETEWQRDEPEIALLSAAAGAPAAGHVPEAIPDPLASIGNVLDLPLLTDAHDQSAPLAYLVAGPDAPGIWTGGSFAASDTGELDSYLEDWASVPASAGAIIGTCAAALPAAEPWVPDFGSSVTVALNAGELTSATLAQLLDEPTRNLAAIASGDGWELIQFMTPELVAPRTWRLSGLLRGLRGTEAAIAGHAANDRFVLLDSAAVRRTLGAGEIGDTDFYIIATTGLEFDQTTAFPLTFTGASHKPYAPVHGAAEQAGADWQITATRRTRIGGGSLDGQDVPLGQASEAWQLDVLNGAAVVRTIAATSLPITYTEAQQITDFGAAVAPSALSVRLYQIDPVLSLRGYPADITG